MPASGVIVTTAVRSGPTGNPRAASGQYFPIGITERGPVAGPVKLNSMADYRRVFGERTSYTTMYDDLAAFFEAGGAQAIAQRAVGPAATAGFLTLNDRVATPQPTVKFNAANPGAWSTGLTVQVEAGTVTDSVRVTLRLNGEVVQTVNNLLTPAAILAAFANSPYVTAQDMGSAGVGVLKLPAISGPTALSAGADDRTNVNASRITALLPLFKIGLGDGAVAAPGFGSAVHAALIAHADANRRIAILATARSTTAIDLATAGAALSSNAGAASAGLFGPWLLVSDGAGGSRAISPEGFVAAARAKSHEVYGPWSPAAGEGSVTPYILGVDQDFSRADAEVLEAGNVSPIRVVANKIRLYGWHSVSSDDENYGSLTVKDTLNRLTTECEARLEPFVFRTVDGRGQLLAQMAGTLIGVCEPMRQAGGLFERVDPATNDILDTGYSVNVSPSINTVETLARNEVRAQVAVRLSPNASLINLTIVKVGLTAAV